MDRPAIAQRVLRAKAKSSQILDAATSVFLEDGFAAASVERIVERAGVSKRTVYKRFRNKDEIFAAVVSKQYASLADAHEEDGFLSNDLEVSLRMIGQRMLEVANRPMMLALLRTACTEATRNPDLTRCYFDSIFERARDQIGKALLKERAITGVESFDAPDAAVYFLDILTGTTFQKVAFGASPPLGASEIDRQVERALRFFFITYRIDGPHRFD